MKSVDVKLRVTGCITGFLVSTGVFAAGQVDGLVLSELPATPFDYSVDGIDYQWGRGSNQILDGFSLQGRGYANALTANDVSVNRDDIANVATGEPCGIFVELLSREDNRRVLATDFPRDDSDAGNCNLEELLDSDIINRGVVDAFSNTTPDAKNIERLDYLFYFTAIAPFQEETLSLGGHIVAEKRGNNAVKMAAITSVSVLGTPASYGPMVRIASTGCSDPEICYGSTGVVENYSFLQNAFNEPQSLPAETERSTEELTMAFVSAADLGLSPGQRYFGVSLFADDVDAAQHDLIDPSTFPDNTSFDSPVVGDDADIYGGLNGYFLAGELNNVSGSLFLDVNMNGVQDADEAGISDVSVALFIDNNNNGMLDEGIDTQIGDLVDSNTDGAFLFPGVADGNFIVVLDDTDPQIPGGLVISDGSNPQAVPIGGTDSNPVSISFISDSGNGSGSINDGSGDGGTGDGATGGTVARVTAATGDGDG